MGLGALGAVPLVLPIIGTLTAGKVLGLAAGGGALYVLSRNKQTFDAPRAPGECDPAVIQAALAQTATNTAGGAAQGSAAGPYGAGAGAGIGAALSVAANPNLAKCGIAAFNKAKANLCVKADVIVTKLRAKGAAIPKAYYGYSCDQKIAFAAAVLGAGPAGVGALVAGTLTASLAVRSGKELSHLTNAAGNYAARVTAGAKLPKIKFPKLFGLGVEEV